MAEERVERPSLVSLAFVRQAAAPANAASIDLKDWRSGVYEGLLLEDKEKRKTHKFWVDKKLHKNCLKVLPEAMYIEGGKRANTWRWTIEKEKCFGGLEDIYVPELLKLSWLEINGSFDTNVLSPKTTYEVAFVVKLRENCSMWPLPVNCELYQPDGRSLTRAESLANKPKEKWIELRVGEFVTHLKNVGKIKFFLHERCQVFKWGLVLGGLVLRPKD